MKPKKLCNRAGCRELVDYEQQYCTKHTKDKEKIDYKAIYKRRRSYESKYLTFYHSQAWVKLSKSFRAAHPLCEECKKHGIIRGAQQVDHIIPIKDDWENRLNTNNLQSLCVSCHSLKTAQEQKEKHHKV